mmetsp:Transcript_14380/g.13972  ORF Transcript_14380/g.13972 Transcript_14380/m.13972 type:complete len:125 (+) Transcript_14380:794-1168(+)
METNSKAAMKEKELIQKIKFLENSKEFIEQVNQVEDKIRVLKKEKFEAGAGLNELKELIKNVKGEISKINQQVEEMDQSKEGIQKQLDKINLDRNAIKKEMAELKAQKEELKEDFYKRLMEYEK